LSQLSSVINGWDLFMTTGLAITALQGLLAGPERYPWWLSAGVAIIWLWYLLVGRQAGSDQPAHGGGLLFSVGAIVLANCAVYLNPFLSALPYILIFYIWWVTLPNRRRAVALTVAIFVTTSATHVIADYRRDGFAYSVPMIIGLWLPLVNLIGMVAICLWLERLFRWGQERLVLVHDLREAAAKETLLQQETAALTERTRLAQEVHDTIAQDLSGLRFLVARARRLAAPLSDGVTLAPADVEALQGTFDLVSSAVEVALTETRGLIATTMPVELDSSLADAIARIAARFSRETGLPVAVEMADARLPRETEVVFVRCLQEGLSNVRKHAQASAVHAAIDVEGDTATFSLSDNGIGLDTSAIADAGFGLPGLRQRIELLGGSFSMLSGGVGQGTTMSVALPICTKETQPTQRGQTNRFSAILGEFMQRPKDKEFSRGDRLSG